MKLTKKQAVKIILKATDRDDPFWGNLVEELYDEETDDMPTIYDVLEPFGITKEEVDLIDEGDPEIV